MAAKGSSVAPPRSTLRIFTAALRSAICEWLLICFLLLDGIFAYLLTEFSRYFQLQVPCIFCSRLDHILGNEKPGYYYRSLICTSHQAEISSLIFCHSHSKLVDGRAMCDDCLVSFSTMLGPNSDMPRAVIGKLGYDLASNGPPTLFTNKDLLPGSVATKVCSCCRKPWRSRQRADRILRLNSPRFPRQESLRKIREKFSGSLTPCRLGNAGFSSLSYSELKFNSDSESEFLYSDDDEYHLDYRHNRTNEQSKVDQQARKLNAADEIEIRQQSFKQQGIPAIPEIIPLDNLPPRNLSEVPHVLKIVIKEQDDPSVLGADDSCMLSELAALVDTPSVSAASIEPFEASDMKGLDGTITDDVQNKQPDVQVAPNVPSTYIIPLQQNETPRSCFNIHERESPQQRETPRSCFNVHERESPQQRETPRSCFNVHERESPQQRETPRSCFNVHERESPQQRETPRSCFNVHERESPQQREMNEHEDDSEMNNIGSSSGGMEMPPEEEPVTRVKVVHQNIDASTLEALVHEIEGESVDDRLKRQLEHDQILISTLTRELEEERSASAIATNEAMAMITRLQAEKAALHMEALQYLRMMEEQAEYDGEELEKTNDLLAEREKEMQDLEAELDHFRLKYPEEEEEEEEGDHQHASSSNAEHNVNGKSNNKGAIFTKSSWPDIEEEKSFIFQRLKSLERKLRKISQTAASPYMSDSEYSEEAAAERSGVVDAGEFFGNGSSHEDSNTSSGGKDGARNGQRPSAAAPPNPQQHNESGELATVKNEISDLNERLEALETDWSFLEHAFNSLEGGQEGLQFVQEIAHHLQELRKIGLRCSRCQPVP